MSDKIEAGRQAWQRLQAHQRAAWADWRAVGEAIKIGRDVALLAANAKTPHGKIYTRIFGDWLRDNGLDEIRQAHRYRLLLCIENIAAIEAWRAGLPERQRDRYNHPDSIWFAWRRAMYGERRPMSRPDRPKSGNVSRGDHHRQVYWSQDHIQRAARAVSESYCGGDVYMIARRALEAAVRSEADLFALIDSHPKQTHQIRKPTAPRQTAAPAAAEVHA